MPTPYLVLAWRWVHVLIFRATSSPEAPITSSTAMPIPRCLMVLAAILGMLACRREPKPPAAAVPAVAAPAAAAVPVPSGPVSGEAFFTAALDGDLAALQQSLAEPDAANRSNPDGRTALMFAAFNGHTEVAVRLLDAGARIDTRDPTGRTALMYACSGPHDVTVAMLLKRGADVNLADSEEHWTPLMFAAAEGHAGVARILLASGANPAAADVDGEDSESFARNRGSAELAELIAQAKARARGLR
ncbi:MAG: ankyrin repeat domain-containing protein [Verrucomicrobia bacterium]|nr:ankyrin repeat domain-containing protein [Verrucomicrobiota bacterium]